MYAPLQELFQSGNMGFRIGSAFQTKRRSGRFSEALKPSYIRGLSLLGGEPFEPENRPALIELVKKVRETFPEKSVWCYTGYDYEKDILTGRVGSPESSDDFCP